MILQGSDWKEIGIPWKEFSFSNGEYSMAVRRKSLGNLVEVLDHFWRFFEPAFSGKSLIFLGERGWFHSGKFLLINLTRLLFNNMITSVIWYSEEISLSNDVCFFLTQQRSSVIERWYEVRCWFKRSELAVLKLLAPLCTFKNSSNFYERSTLLLDPWTFIEFLKVTLYVHARHLLNPGTYHVYLIEISLYSLNCRILIFFLIHLLSCFQ